jgi:Fe-Mn family superoxide dismutase
MSAIDDAAEQGQELTASAARLTRRELLTAVAVASAGAALPACHAPPASPQSPRPSPSTGGSTMPSEAALAGNHAVVPLPFAPGALSGLSERLITSHHDNNYGGAVKNLNRVEQELAAITTDTAPLVVAALRERELTFRNSKTLHEAYFANLGGDGRRSGAIDAAVGEAYGSAGRWEEHFRLTGMGLGGGSGWVILGYELDSAALRTFWSGNHTQAPVTCVPLLVMDMYEHSYALDYGSAHARYIDAFFANLNWDEVNRRLERARQAAAVLRGSA